MVERIYGYLAGFSPLLGLVFVMFMLLYPIFLRVWALVIIPRRRRPAEAQAWLLFIFVTPLLGWLLYLLIGNPKLSVQRRQQQREMTREIAARVDAAEEDPRLRAMFVPDVPERYVPFIRLNERLSGLPLFGGNDLELLPDYQGAVGRIVADIEAAQRYVHVEYFMFADDETGARVVDALLRAQQRGVVCRVLVDHLGNFGFNGRLFRRLRAGGVQVEQMLPVRPFDAKFSRIDLRNHRKIVVIDGAVGFTGSQNLINSDYHKRYNKRQGLYYEELVARVTGPVVIQLQAVFATDWFAETGELLDPGSQHELAFVPELTGSMLGQVLPSGSGFENENNLRLFIALIYAARERIVITTPYFVPDEALLMAITIAAQRGVRVTLIVSGVADQFLVSRAQRSYYAELLEAGVEIRLFERPVMLHSKTMSIDDDIALIGSSNMDMRSFLLNLEVTLVLYDAAAVQQLRLVETTYLARSQPLQQRVWRRRPMLEWVVQNTARLMSPLL